MFLVQFASHAPIFCFQHQVKDSLTPAGPTGPRNVVKELVGQVGDVTYRKGRRVDLL